MAYETPGVEIVDEGISEINTDQNPLVIGFIAMPEEIKEVYYVAKKSDQLVIPDIADPMDSTPVKH